MVLYHAFTTYHLFEFCIHRLVYHQQEEALLVYPECLLEKYPQMDELIEKKIFTRVHQIYGSSREGISSITNLSTFEKLVIPIENVDEIYIAGAQNAFAFWLIERNIKFHFCEEACGRLSRPEVIMENDRAIDAKRYRLALDYGMYTGENQCVVKILCNKEAQRKEWKNEKAVHFDVIADMEKLPPVYLRGIKEFFHVPDIRIEKGIFLLTQHFANLKMMTYKDQIDLYTETVDYYFNNRPFVIKTHPDDILPYHQIFPNAIVIREKFPSELLAIAGEKTQNCTISTISSTGIDNIKNHFKNVIRFNTEYEKSFRKNPLYYAVAKLCRQLGYRKKSLISFANTEQFTNMCKSVMGSGFFRVEEGSSLSDAEKGDYILIDRELEDYQENGILDICQGHDGRVIFFLNQFHSLLADLLLLEQWKPYLIVKKIEIYDKKTAQLKEVLPLFAFSRNLEVKRKMMNFELDREMKYSDIYIRVGKNSQDEETLMIMEGQLAAAEQKINRLKTENKQLLEKVRAYEQIYADSRK